MTNEAAVGLAFTLVLAVGVGLALSLPDQASTNEPIPLGSLRSMMRLERSANWDINILRRSGYAHSTWTFRGTPEGALDFAISKLRQARIDHVAIKRNEPRCMEVAAFYESAGQRRTGKYIGGFVITPRSG